MPSDQDTANSSLRKRCSKASEHQSYIFRIEDSEMAYSLANDQKGWTAGPYWEHVELSIAATILVPQALQGRQGTLDFLSDRRITRDLDSPIDSRTEPLCVGTLTIWGQRTSYLGSLPHDVIWHVFAASAGGQFRMLALSGERLYRGNAKIQTVHFGREIDPEEW
jgi:hypothetical protein